MNVTILVIVATSATVCVFGLLGLYFYVRLTEQRTKFTLDRNDMNHLCDEDWWAKEDRARTWNFMAQGGSKPARQATASRPTIDHLAKQHQLQIKMTSAVTDRVVSLESYRKHHATRLNQLEDQLQGLQDLVELLNRDASGVQYDIDSTQPMRPVVRAASFADRRKQIESPTVEVHDLTEEEMRKLSDTATRTQALFDLDDNAFVQQPLAGYDEPADEMIHAELDDLMTRIGNETRQQVNEQVKPYPDVYLSESAIVLHQDDCRIL